MVKVGQSKTVAINPDYSFRAELERVIDGDTFDLRIDLGFHCSITIRARLFGANAPELHGVKHGTPEHEAGIVAAKAAQAWFDSQKDALHIRTFKDRRTFGRWVAVIEGYAGTSLAEAMIRNGFARAADEDGNDIERRAK